MKKYLLILILIFELGCIKERTTNEYASIKNNTTHKVKITFYYSGVTYPDKILTLNPGDLIKFGSCFTRGIANHGGFCSDYFGSADDSIVVTFDNLYSITHYANPPTSMSFKHYLYSSLRNLGNYLSWEYSFQDDSKYKRQAYYLYRFVEQDYLDAK